MSPLQISAALGAIGLAVFVAAAEASGGGERAVPKYAPPGMGCVSAADAPAQPPLDTGSLPEDRLERCYPDVGLHILAVCGAAVFVVALGRFMWLLNRNGAFTAAMSALTAGVGFLALGVFLVPYSLHVALAGFDWMGGSRPAPFDPMGATSIMMALVGFACLFIGAGSLLLALYLTTRRER